jgi:hypothetical protein
MWVPATPVPTYPCVAAHEAVEQVAHERRGILRCGGRSIGRAGHTRWTGELVDYREIRRGGCGVWSVENGVAGEARRPRGKRRRGRAPGRGLGPGGRGEFMSYLPTGKGYAGM